MQRSTLINTARTLLVSVMTCLCGCEPVSRNAEPPHEIEPSEADRPHAFAARSYLQANVSRAPHDSSDEWPQLFGPDRTSAVRCGRIDPIWDAGGPRELWSIEVGTGYGSPVVSSGRVVFNHRVGDEEIIQCVDAESGQAIWEHRSVTTFQCEYEYSSGPYSTPVICDGDVYALGGQGQVFCLDLATGETRWSRHLHEHYELNDDIFAVGSSPGIAGKRLIVNVGAVNADAGVVALDRETGETAWESTDHGAAYCSPFAATIHGEPFVFVVTQVGLVSLHPETGSVDWMIEHRSRSPMSYNAVSPLVQEGKVLVVTGPGPGALCVEVQPDRSYKQVWKHRRVLDCQFNTLLLDGENVYGFTSAGQGGAEFRCVDINTGDLKWKYRSLLRRGQGLIAGNAIILLGERGHLASLLLDADSPQVLSFTEQPLMSEPCYCAPAYASGRLYLKDEQRIACFDVESK